MYSLPLADIRMALMTAICTTVWQFNQVFVSALFHPASYKIHAIADKSQRPESMLPTHIDKRKKEYSNMFLHSIQGQFGFVSGWIISLGLGLCKYKQGTNKILGAWLPRGLNFKQACVICRA
jgi:hypothetical protein